MSSITLRVFRDLSNREAGEPDDGPMAWAAHRERRRVLAEVLDDPAFHVQQNEEAEDEKRPHELAETVLLILATPTAQVVLTAAALYVGKVLAKAVDDKVTKGVQYLFQKLFDAFRKKKIQDFSMQLPEQSQVVVRYDAVIEVSIQGQNVVSFPYDKPPKDDTAT